VKHKSWEQTVKGTIEAIAKRIKGAFRPFGPIDIARTYAKLIINSRKEVRRLEIGSGPKRLKEFETLDIAPGWNIDYVWDAAKKLPFKDNTFELIYASHVLEHISWYKVEDTLKEWTRILKPGGWLEIWVPDGLKICKTLVDYELYGKNYIDKDGWYRYNPEKDPCKWAAGRLFTYGDGRGNPKGPNWHRSIFTERYLRMLFEKAGLKNIRKLSNTEVRGYDHGWINLGMAGTKV
jgi:SAM-dependent methyltransferase